MTLEYVIPAGDRVAFLGCRRAWDLSARERGNHQAARVKLHVDPAAAFRQAFTVYYFPGMWDWQPAMVLRLVRMAYLDELTAQRERYLSEHGLKQLNSEQEQEWIRARDHGLALLERYFEWAPTVDNLSPVLVGAEFDVQIPNPGEPDRSLVTPDGRAVHYRGQIDLLVIDESDGYWMVEHRMVHGPFPPTDLLRLSERCLSWCWAWEAFYPGMRIEGTVFNELRHDGPTPAGGPATPIQRGAVAQNRGAYLRPWGQPEPHPDEVGEVDLTAAVAVNGPFRRVVVPRARAEVAEFGTRIAGQVTEMITPGIHCHPTPSIARCADCEFRTPCQTMNEGHDPTLMLASEYVHRSHEPTPGRLGSGTWSIGRGAAPPKFGGLER
ncbi:MAG: hypothetical protein JO100_06340 [Pseudonocardia sp.]|nr:hypothetical protein [Pseudonocardia sp.]